MDSLIENWVEWRYKLIILYTFLYCSLGIFFPFLVRNSDLTLNWAYYKVTIVVVVGTVLEFMCWAVSNLLQPIITQKKMINQNINELIDEQKILKELKK